MLKVSFEKPLVVSETDLVVLLNMVKQVPTNIEVVAVAAAEKGKRGRPAGSGAKRGPKPKAEVPVTEATGSGEPVPADMPAAGPVAGDAPKRRGRPPKAKPEDAPAAVAPAKDAAAESARAAATNSIELLKRFSALVEKDYDKALASLEMFGCGKFSELAEENYSEFGKVLADAGV